MKLYFSPAACSLAAHIVLHEAGLKFSLIKVDLRTHLLEDGSDYRAINPKGPVPLLELSNGERITEVAAILQYIADQVPDKKLVPLNGTFERVRLQEMLNFIATDIHKNGGILFNPKVDDATKVLYRQKLRSCYEYIDAHLAQTGWSVGDDFTVADAYLFVMINACSFIKLDLNGLNAIAHFMEYVQDRPSVKAALRMEGLI